MSKGPKIKEWVKRYIGDEALKKENRAKPRDFVAEKIEEYLKDKEPVPSRDTINKMISAARNNNDPEDKPWSTATLDSYPFPPEALPLVLKLWKSRVEKGDTFTIREAKWAARLSVLLEDIAELSHKASVYARAELMYQLTHRDFDSTGLDRLLMGLPLDDEQIISFVPLVAEKMDLVKWLSDYLSGKSKEAKLELIWVLPKKEDKSQ